MCVLHIVIGLVLLFVCVCMRVVCVCLCVSRFADLIKNCEEAGMPKYKLFASLGNCVVISDPPQKDRLPLLNSV